jgi:tetratricopeptide (TPR) repeat protein
MDDSAKRCLNCDASYKGLKRCPRCKQVYFCNATCQKEVWKEHVKVCVPIDGEPAQPPPKQPSAAAAAKPPADSQAATAAPKPGDPPVQKTPEQIKADQLLRIRHEILPEAARLMSAREFADAEEQLEDGVAIASQYDERELLNELSCALSKCFMIQDKYKQALEALNPALMHARREGGPEAMRPHSIAAEINKAKGDVDQMRVELRALMEAASESNDEQEQGAALLLAGCLLFDVGDLNAAVPLLSSAATAGEKLGNHNMRAGARNRAGAALLRMRQPKQAVEAWMDELKVLEQAGAEEAMAAMKVKEEPKEEEIEKKKPEMPPLGDTRGRRCKAHGNVFMAHLLMGTRPAAEVHLQHALSIAKELGKEEEARVWLQCGNSHTLASVDGSNDGDATEAYKKCLDLAKEVKSLELIAAAEKGLKKDLDVATMLRG